MTTSAWLIEGAPGSGKTETARRLCDAARSNGRVARWWREEESQHPVTPALLRKRSSEPDFTARCAQSLRQCLHREAGVLIFEGVVFQSILRFLFAQGVGQADMARAVEALSSALAVSRTRLLLLTIEDPSRFYSEFVRPLRGEEWMDRLLGYVERTPIARQQGWVGFDGFVWFWTEYQELCLWASERLGVSVLRTPSVAREGLGLTMDVRRFFDLGSADHAS